MQQVGILLTSALDLYFARYCFLYLPNRLSSSCFSCFPRTVFVQRLQPTIHFFSRSSFLCFCLKAHLSHSYGNVT
jgi:hypothetical protein